MALARFQFSVLDNQGNVVPSANVTVRLQQIGLPLANIFSDRNGTTPLGNPFAADSNGFAAFHVAGGSYQITASVGTFSRTWTYVGIGLLSEADSISADMIPNTAVTPGSYGAANTASTFSVDQQGRLTAAGNAPIRVGPGNIANTSVTTIKLANQAVTSAKVDSTVAKLDTEDQVLSGGARVTEKNLGVVNSGTLTPDPGDRPLQRVTANGSFTLAPGSNHGAYILTIVNGASASTITTSGWTSKKGDNFTTTNGHKFRCHGSIGADGSLLVVQAMQ